jgi:acetyltransferase-like isoleucine patch superfamily enzyme/2-polyprenyl-3-methyl-5-hydroxy-6-metoxy-1,4-benzoquinol methylase
MIFANIKLGAQVEIEPSSSINNVIIGDHVKIAKRCSIYGGPDNQLELGENSYVGMCSILNGFSAKLKIGKNVSISQFVNIMVDSGPNASPGMLRVFPIVKGPIDIGNDCWIGANAIIMPNVTLGEFSVVASNSFVNKSFPSFSIIGGTPARLLRSFTDVEKEKMISRKYEGGETEQSEYEKHYLDLPFEDDLREFRHRNVLSQLNKYSHSRFLDIGCGADPIFLYGNGFTKIIVVEPGKTFVDKIRLMVKTSSNILIINDLIENVIEELQQESFDFILVGGFLHEIDNPDIVLKNVRRICSENTVVYSYVPNAKSFHRLLAYKMGIIENIYQKSGHDDLFSRQNVFDNITFNELLVRNKFKVIDSGSYFIKPFTHEQMDRMMSNGIIDFNCLDGLEKMIDFLPEMGAELWNICKIDD